MIIIAQMLVGIPLGIIVDGFSAVINENVEAGKEEYEKDMIKKGLTPGDDEDRDGVPDHLQQDGGPIYPTASGSGSGSGTGMLYDIESGSRRDKRAGYGSCAGAFACAPRSTRGRR